MSAADARQLRERQPDLAGAIDRVPVETDAGTMVLVVQTTTVASYPAVAGAVYACHPVVVSFTEAEGAVPTLSAQAGLVYCVNVGSAVPPPGTYRIAALIDGLLTFNFS